MKLTKSILLVLMALTMFVMSGCYFLPEEEEVLEAPVVKASEVSYTTTTAELKDITKQVLTAGTIASGTEYKARFTDRGGNIKGVYVSAGDVVEVGDLIAEFETYELDIEISLMELEMQREELEYQIAIEKKESETVKAKELLDIQLLQNELDKLYAEKDAAKLYTDVAGTVSQVMTLSPGDWVNAGEVVATVIDITDLYIKINPDDNVSEFMVGRPITIRYEGEYFDGTIVESTISRLWDETTGAAKVDENGEYVTQETSDRIIVKFNDMIPESSAVGNIADTLLILDKRENVIVISANLIKTVNNVKCVYVFENNQKVQRNVAIGLQSGSLVEITSGLEVGDEIIIR
ncbi:MAG: HlyD family efflux transporter periplasmic adaptor subunit [Oscillospiraceae bacterium]|nr:HlyD family efflux transporter periplasmic adaptor subunit [Oscillospiraceae bacterium]